MAVVKCMAPTIIWLAIFLIFTEVTNHGLSPLATISRPYASIPSLVLMTISAVSALRVIWRKPVFLPLKIVW